MFYVGEITDLEAGIAGEHLVCAELILKGYRAFKSDQNCPYDVAVEYKNQLIRIQVKSTRKPKAVPQRKSIIPAYMWHVRRAGKGGNRVYGNDDFDILALVALDTAKIAYTPIQKVKNTIHIRVGKNISNKGYSFEQFSFEGALGEKFNR